MAISCNTTELKCASCGGAHESTYAFCKERMRQHNVQTAMATGNLIKHEALKLFPRQQQNPFSYDNILRQNPYNALDLDNENEFPALTTQKKQPSRIPSHEKPVLPAVTIKRARSRNRRDRSPSNNIEMVCLPRSITDCVSPVVISRGSLYQK
ncbi:hypothetical protein DMENIID0001_089670 [Sergentomyia squamirostris]